MLGQPLDRAGRQPRGVLAEQIPQRRPEVAGREAVQVQDRQHLGHLRRPPRVRRQDPRAEPLALTGLLVDALVVHPRRPDRHRARPDRHPPLPRTTVADDQPLAVLIDLVHERARRTRRPRPRAPPRSSDARPRARDHRACPDPCCPPRRGATVAQSTTCSISLEAAHHANRRSRALRIGRDSGACQAWNVYRQVAIGVLVLGGVQLFWRDRDGQDGSGQISRNHGTLRSPSVAVVIGETSQPQQPPTRSRHVRTRPRPQTGQKAGQPRPLPPGSPATPGIILPHSRRAAPPWESRCWLSPGDTAASPWAPEQVRS